MISTSIKDKWHIISYSALAKLEAESERTYMGYLWWIIDPLMMMGVYYLIFKVMLNRGGPDYLHFLFIGLLTWRWLDTSIKSSAQSIIGNQGLMKQVYLPKFIFPLTNIMLHTYKFLIVFVFVVILYLLTGYNINIHYLFLPIVIVSQFTIAIGIGFFLSSISPFVPDLSFIIGHGMRIIFYPSGILFSLEKVPDEYKWLIVANPLVGLFQSYRNIVMYNNEPVWTSLILSIITGVIFGVAGIIILNKNDRHYPKFMN